MYVRGITILPREDSVMGKGLKKLIKGPCPLEDMATAWELINKSIQPAQCPIVSGRFFPYMHISVKVYISRSLSPNNLRLC